MKKVLVNFSRSFLVIDFANGVITRHGDHGKLIARWNITNRRAFGKQFTSVDVERLRTGACG